MNIVLRNVSDSSEEIVDVVISDGHISERLSTGVSYDEVDCTGLHVLPGFVDLHTHLREPGFENSETILSGSRSAASGGYTAVHAMANTFPVADTAGVVEQVLRIGREVGLVHVQPIGAVTVGLKGLQLAELGAMAESSAAVRIFSDDGSCVDDPLLMRRALEYVKAFDGIIAQHAQDPRLTIGAQMNEGNLSRKMGLVGWPALAEESIIARDLMLAELTESRLHICHVSTARSVELVREAKARGVRVTAEVTPHHLMLSEVRASEYDPLFKVNPPLRLDSDVHALRNALIDGTIDVVATDHAPHPRESKDTDWESAAFGMVGLENAYSVAQEVLVNSGASSMERLAQVMSMVPATIACLSDQGRYLESGSVANLTVVDTKQKWTSGSTSNSKSENNPFSGKEFTGGVVHTIYKGQFTYRNQQLREMKSIV